MKQILQNLRTGELLLEEVPCPKARPGTLLIRTSCSLISPGTERMLVDFGRSGYLAKAKQQPEKVRQLIDKARTDGLLATYHAVTSRLDQPLPLGYCNVGEVLEVGEGAEGFDVGDRVASNGPHAEVVCVPANLCASVPPGLADEDAVFTAIAAIALQGVRLVNPTLCETIAVFGLGLVGLVAVQLLEANGARVLGFDYDEERVQLAKSLGVEAIDLSSGVDPVVAGTEFSGGHGTDGVLVTASTQSHDLMHQAAQVSRRRGRIVLTGVAGLHLNRSDFYEKELTFQVSCSYGPGRYDPAYEERGEDYPLAFVRWTENRNFQSVLELMAAGRINVAPLVSKRVQFSAAKEAYDALVTGKDIGILLEYERADAAAAQTQLRESVVRTSAARSLHDQLVVGVIGAGNFTRQMLLPVLGRSDARLKWVASSGGVSGAHAARKFSFENATTESQRIVDDPEVNAVFITTRHDTHATLVIDCLRAGKNVFVEKPLCITREELDAVAAAYDEASSASSDSRPVLMVGFNRRFAPLTAVVKERLEGRQAPISLTFTCNAGAIPPDHWLQRADVGGGRIIGEACHFFDLLSFLSDARVTRVGAIAHPQADDNAAMTLAFEDGSVGHVNYFANGSKRYPKERLDVFFDGKVLSLINFRQLTGYGVAGFSNKKLWKQDKGHEGGFLAFLNAVKEGGESPIPFDSLVATTRATLCAVESMRMGEIVVV